MKAPFSVVRMHFPDTDSVSLDELWLWLGYPENIKDINFSNTCAVRMSLALLGAGFPSPGNYPVRAGKHKGKAIETRQRKLSNWLITHLGAPEKYKSGAQAQGAIGSRRGIISSSNSTGRRIDKGTSPSWRRIDGRRFVAGLRTSDRRPGASGMRLRFGSGR